MKRPIQLGLAGLAVSLSLVLVSWGGSPTPVADTVMQGELKYLQDELKKAKILKKAERKVRMSAVLLAAAAKGAGDKHAHVAARAFELSRLMDEGKHDEARKVLAEMMAGKGGGKAGSYKDAIDLELLMRIFSSEKIGGFGLEVALEDLVALKGAPSEDEAKKAMQMAAKIALITEVALDFPPEKDAGMKTKKAWEAYARDTSKVALELVGAAAKKSPDIAKVADKLSKTCTNCHDVFR